MILAKDEQSPLTTICAVVVFTVAFTAVTGTFLAARSVRNSSVVVAFRGYIAS